MAKKTKTTQETEIKLEDTLGKDMTAAWEALTSLREKWEEKEKALLAQTADSFSGSVSRVRVTDAALSTFSFERQARVAAQLPTGKLFASGRKDDGKAKLLNIVLQRYIIPNAGDGYDMLTLQRLWGVYASVYGSMPMMYDYRVDDDYIGPYSTLVDPHNYLPQPGFYHVKQCDWVMISSVVSTSFLKTILEKDKTTYDKKAVTELLELSKDGRPSKDDDSTKESFVSSSRARKDLAKGRVELVTKYEKGKKGKWITFAPDYKNIIIRNIPNPHKSGHIPVVMRYCFPLLNSMYGLSDFDRGMKIQKAKDSLLGLRLEYVKNKTFPALMIDTTKVTPSTIKHGANAKWLVTDMNAVKEFSGGTQPSQEFNSMFSVLNGIQQSQFGTTNVDVSAEDSADPSVGKTPAAIKQNASRENARDTWDRFLHETATAELYEGMVNLLMTKMEKPIEVSVFEEEIRQIADTVNPDILEMIGSDYGKLTLAKKDLNSDKGFKFQIDSNSSMKQDDETQLAALQQTYMMASQDPMLQQKMAESGVTWDQVEHFKKILIASGISDWERILQEGSEQGEQGVEGEMGNDPDGMAQQQMLQQQQMMDEDVRNQAMSQVDTLPPELDQLIQAVGIQGGVNG